MSVQSTRSNILYNIQGSSGPSIASYFISIRKTKMFFFSLFRSRMLKHFSIVPVEEAERGRCGQKRETRAIMKMSR